FTGNSRDPQLSVACTYEHAASNPRKLSGNLALRLTNTGQAPCTVTVTDNAYKTGARTQRLQPGQSKELVVDLRKSHGWYDCSVQVKGSAGFEKRYAGRVETGRESYTDPLMGRV